MRYGWSKEEIKILKEFYKSNIGSTRMEIDTKQLAERLGRTKAAIQVKAYKLGLTIQKRGETTNESNRYYIDTVTGCWNWKLFTNEDGYAIHPTRESNTNRSHKIYYERKFGKVPNGMQLDHICKNRSCVNPDHLEVVTPAENTRRGNLAKLNMERVKEIREWRRVNMNVSVRDASKILNVSKANLYMIFNNKRWREE